MTMPLRAPTPGPLRRQHGSRRRRGCWLAVLASLLPLVISGPTRAQEPDPLDMDLEALLALDVTVTSPARRKQRLGDAPTAVFVLSGEEIRRSGALDVPDALRLVPGVQVARIDGSKWSVTARGFSGRLANKLQVLIDGQSVYSPVFSGVFWDQHDLALDDIERIEVIRGPAAALWGANAVNGTINIITKSAEETTGGLVSGTVGNEQGVLVGRYGAPLGDIGAGRITAKTRRVDAGERDGAPADDDWATERIDFRADLTPTQRDSFTFLGNVVKVDSGSTTSMPSLTAPFLSEGPSDLDFLGASILSSWQRRFSTRSQVTAQAYYQYADTTLVDKVGQRDVLSSVSHIVDVQFEYGFPIADRQQVVIGTEYRSIDVSTGDTEFFEGDNSKSSSDVASVFLHDTISAIPGLLEFTLASRLDYNSLTGFEVQPTGRVLWTPRPDLSVWGAVSRAVRTPSIIELATERFFLAAMPTAGGVPVALVDTGTDQPTSEEVIAYEAGVRYQITPAIDLDIATFFNQYDNLQSVETWAPVFTRGPPSALEVQTAFENRLEGQSYGAEVAAGWNVLENWRLTGAYTFLVLDLWAEDGSTDSFSVDQEGRSPVHQAVVRSALDVSETVDFDLTLRLVDQLETASVPGYVDLDARLAWRPLDGVELAIIGRNLIDCHDLEFVNTRDSVKSTESGRSVFGSVRVRF